MGPVKAQDVQSVVVGVVLVESLPIATDQPTAVQATL